MLGLKSETLIKQYKIKVINDPFLLPIEDRHLTFYSRYQAYYKADKYVYVANEHQDKEAALIHEISHALDRKFGCIRDDICQLIYSQNPEQFSLSRPIKIEESVANIFTILADPKHVSMAVKSLKSYKLSIYEAIRLSEPILRRRFIDMGIDINWKQARKYLYDVTETIPKGLF